ANATLFANCAPLFVALVAWLFFGERLTARFLAALGVTLAGAALVVGATFAAAPSAPLGDALGLLTAAFFAGYLLVVKRLRESFSAGAIMARSGAVTTLALLFVAVGSGEALIAETVAGWAVLAGLALFAHCGGQGLIAWSLARLPVMFSSVALLLETVSAALLAWLLLAEALSLWQAAGGVVVLLGIMLASRAGVAPAPALADSGAAR
ncbi:MAG: DMT family transporter, partial [Alphaproteobacteria bacterium]|nr:DMT family transporter [Alphaproteobacteria bacterium]